MAAATPSPGKIAAIIAFGPFLAQLDSALINVALSNISHELHSPIAVIQWVTSGYLLALALMIPLNGWLVDCVGAKRIYILCFGVFTLASLLCGFATTAGQLIAFRVLQGMAGGLLAPMTQVMVARHGGANMARMFTMVTFPVIMAPIFGPSIAGLVLHFASWRWLFFLTAPIALAALLVSAWLLPKDEGTKPRRLDLAGFLMVSTGLVFFLDGMRALASLQHGVFRGAELVTGLLLVGAFVIRSYKRGAAALIDVQLFANRIFSAAASAQFLAHGVTQGALMLIPLYLLVARDMPPATAGLMLAPMGVGVLCTRPVIDYAIRRFGPRAVAVFGSFVCLLGTIMFALPGAAFDEIAICVSLFFRGVGVGFSTMPSLVSAYTTVPKHLLTDAATALNILQRLGAPVATMAIAVTLQALTPRAPETATLVAGISPNAFTFAFQLLCLINVMGMIAAMRLPRSL